MSRHRLYIPQPISGGEALCLDGEQVHYLSRVLRLKLGSKVLLFDGSGFEYEAVVIEVQKKKILLQPGPPISRDVESPLQIRLVQGISRGERMDFVVQKATELGVHRISPVLTEHSVVKLNADRSARRLLHWKNIAQSACEQCGRNKLPIIDEIGTLPDLLRQDTLADCRLLLQPSASNPLHKISKPASSVDLMIGPEGGISSMETAMLDHAGFRAVSLGPRILRTETAALAALTVMQSHWGDL